MHELTYTAIIYTDTMQSLETGVIMNLFICCSLYEISSIGEAQAETLLPFVSENRLQKIQAYHFDKDKKLSLFAFLLLRYLLNTQYHIKKIPEFSYNGYKKPYLADFPDIYFNFSHCDDAVLCAISSCEIGTDIQNFPEFNIMELTSVLSDKEKAIVTSAENTKATFTRFWCLKESYLKCVGTGINGRLENISFADFIDRTFTYNDCYFTTGLKSRHAYSLCCRTEHNNCLSGGKIIQLKTESFIDWVLSSNIQKR